MNVIFFRLIKVLFLLFGFVFTLEATHIRAGEITVVRLSQNTFEFTLTVYANEAVFPGVENKTAILDFGDGTVSNEVNFSLDDHDIDPKDRIYVRNYIFTHTYTGNGYFRVSYTEVNRVAEIRNISGAVNVPFYIETLVSVSAQNVGNNPPYLQVPPIDEGRVGALFTHNAGAVDPDGDSLSYKLIVPKQNSTTAVPGYFDPEASTSFSLNPITGDLVWDSPIIPGVYNIAFIIEEWRKAPGGYIRISYITRDMQIRITNVDNKPPQVFVPNDTCVVAGSTITKTITATDPPPQLDLVTLEAFPSNYFSVTGSAANPKSGTFSWTTTCNDAQQQPHFFTFKATDNNPDILTNFNTWQIQVIAPAPTGLVATGLTNSIQLTWNLYPCQNAQLISVYRLSCDSIIHTQTVCENGLDGFPGYVKIADVGKSVTIYNDTKVKQGVLYCYLLVAKFPAPGLGESYASLQDCATLSGDRPVIAAVSVKTTDPINGEIDVEWIDPILPSVPAPYTYNIFRSDNNGVTFTQVASNESSPYTDNSLNTAQIRYQYKIELVGVGLSDAVSSTFLTAVGSNNAVKLSWTEVSSWGNDSVYVFRKISNGSFLKIATIIPDANAYTDNNVTNCDTVQYYIQRFHQYCAPALDSVYDQSSEVVLAIPKDDRIPPAPTLTVKGCDGDLSIFSNILNWTDVSDLNCPNIISYNLYYSEYSGSEASLMANVPFTQLTYTDVDSQSLAGCYVVKAVNFQNVEGEASNKVCVDDCVFYELPNLITPNGDTKNDQMNPFPIPRGVEVVTLRVFNNWGQQVYAKETGPYVNWGGYDGAGVALNDGVYYFSAEVRYFRRQNPKDEERIIKGWVHIVDRRGGQATD